MEQGVIEEKVTKLEEITKEHGTDILDMKLVLVRITTLLEKKVDTTFWETETGKSIVKYAFIIILILLCVAIGVNILDISNLLK